MAWSQAGSAGPSCLLLFAAVREGYLLPGALGRTTSRPRRVANSIFCIARNPTMARTTWGMNSYCSFTGCQDSSKPVLITSPITAGGRRHTQSWALDWISRILPARTRTTATGGEKKQLRFLASLAGPASPFHA